MKILAIEDNPADVELLRMALDSAEQAYDLTIVNDGAEALALLGRLNLESDRLPDVLVLDLNLPKYDGLEILEVVRKYPKLDHLPILVLTSSSSPRERASVQGFGLVRYITKPSDLDDFLKIGPFIRDFVLESRAER
jgi:CheY-like chemotaxis protein